VSSMQHRCPQTNVEVALDEGNAHSSGLPGPYAARPSSLRGEPWHLAAWAGVAARGCRGNLSPFASRARAAGAGRHTGELQPKPVAGSAGAVVASPFRRGVPAISRTQDDCRPRGRSILFANGG